MLRNCCALTLLLNQGCLCFHLFQCKGTIEVKIACFYAREIPSLTSLLVYMKEVASKRYNSGDRMIFFSFPFQLSLELQNYSSD